MTNHTTNQGTVRVFADRDALFIAAAEYWISTARVAVAEHGGFHVALAGGSTPAPLYRLLTQAPYSTQLDWSATHVYFGDERAVDWDNPESNYRMAREQLLNHVPIPPGHVHPIRARLGDIRRGAHAYAELLKTLPPQVDGWPRLDLVLLGMGRDGHTASLFPSSCLLHDQERPVAPNYAPSLHTWRVSLTLPAINKATHILIMVTGQDKADTLSHVLAGDGSRYPIQRVHNDGELFWFVDADAASRMSESL